MSTFLKLEDVQEEYCLPKLTLELVTICASGNSRKAIFKHEENNHLSGPSSVERLDMTFSSEESVQVDSDNCTETAEG